MFLKAGNLQGSQAQSGIFEFSLILNKYSVAHANVDFDKNMLL